MQTFLKGNGYKTVPQIFYNGTEYIGDYTMFKERLNKQKDSITLSKIKTNSIDDSAITIRLQILNHRCKN